MHQPPGIELTAPDDLPMDQIALSPDGRILATTGYRWGQPTEVLLWDTETGELQRRHELATHARTGLFAYSRGGRFLAYTWETLFLLDASTLELAGEFGRPAVFSSIDFTSDDRLLVAAGWDQQTRLWDTQSKKEVHRAPPVENARFVSFASGDSQVAVGTTDGLYVWDVPSGKLVHQFRIPDRCARSWRHYRSHDRRILVSLTDRRDLITRDTTTWQGVRTRLRRDSGEARCLSPDAAYLAIASRKGTLLVWDIRNSVRRSRRKTPYSEIDSLAFSPDGSRIVCLGGRTRDGEYRKSVMIMDSPIAETATWAAR